MASERTRTVRRKNRSSPEGPFVYGEWVGEFSEDERREVDARPKNVATENLNQKYNAADDEEFCSEVLLLLKQGGQIPMKRRIPANNDNCSPSKIPKSSNEIFSDYGTRPIGYYSEDTAPWSSDIMHHQRSHQRDYSSDDIYLESMQEVNEESRKSQQSVLGNPEESARNRRNVPNSIEHSYLSDDEPTLHRSKSSEQQLFRRTATDYVELINWALQQLPKRRGTAEQVFQKLKEQGCLKITNIRAVIFYKNLINEAMSNYFLERSHTERGDVIYEADPDDEEEAYMEDGRNEEDSVLPDRMDTDKSTQCTKHRYSVIKCSVDCPFRPHNVILQQQKQKEAVERDREKRARAERKARREQSRPDDWINDSLLDDKKLKKTKPKQPTNQDDKPHNSNNNSSGRRWIRFACEKHRREHSRCPDNCPMRKKSLYEPEGEGSFEDNGTFSDMNLCNGITQLGLPFRGEFVATAFANATP